VGQPIVLLHGFSGTARAWDRVVSELERERYRPAAVDLRGHGSAAGRRPVTFEDCVRDIVEQAPPRFVLAGYSMGGRIALRLALGHPDRVQRLVLVSASGSASERARRRRDDEAVANRIEAEGMEVFARRWAAQPLFSGQAPDVAAEAHADRMRNQSEGLAAALRGLGTGVMEPLWDRLGELAMPVTVVVGERDERFCAIGRRLAAGVQRGTLVAVPGAGHAVHLEAPGAVATAIGASLEPESGARGYGDGP
jgi:2-succinyl-6-hydroxy-2,4-cyclohexadiene-1-carboxylate synthase